MGPIQQLFALIQQAQQEQAMQRPHGGMLEPESVFAPRRGVGPRPFRDPEQMGPAPPTDGPIASLYRRAQ